MRRLVGCRVNSESLPVHERLELNILVGHAENKAGLWALLFFPHGPLAFNSLLYYCCVILLPINALLLTLEHTFLIASGC